MGNQVYSIHLPDSFPFLQGALARAVWSRSANRLSPNSPDGFPVCLPQALSPEGDGATARGGRTSSFVELLGGAVLDRTVRFSRAKILEGGQKNGDTFLGQGVQHRWKSPVLTVDLCNLIAALLPSGRDCLGVCV